MSHSGGSASSGGSSSGGGGGSSSGQGGEQLSRTNLYIRGLSPDTTDKDLVSMCKRFKIIGFFIDYFNYFTTVNIMLSYLFEYQVYEIIS